MSETNLQNSNNKNKQKHKKHFSSKGIIVCIILSIIVLSIVFQFLRNPYNTVDTLTMTFLGIFPSLISYFLFTTNNNNKSEESSKAMYENIRQSVIVSDENASLKSSPSENSSDILELMLANMKEINDYYVLSKNQAKNSFFLAVMMCISGFILMGIAIVASFTEAEFSSIIIPAVGSAIVELIAGTSLIVYKKSLTQLNHYYASLHNNERFLSIVNLVNKLSTEKQDNMYSEIIRSQISEVSKKS